MSLFGPNVQVVAGSFTETNVTFNIFNVIAKEVKIVGTRHKINEIFSLCIYPMVKEFAFADAPTLTL